MCSNNENTAQLHLLIYHRHRVWHEGLLYKLKNIFVIPTTDGVIVGTFTDDTYLYNETWHMPPSKIEWNRNTTNQ